jgi:hypothetical protein
VIQVYVLLPRNPPGPEESSNHSHTTLLHSTAYRTAAIRTRPRCSSTAKDGSSQTRWCTQVMGLTRQAARPVRANAPLQSSSATARDDRHAHTHSTTRAAAAQAVRLGSPGAASRARTPCKDWLET